MSKRRQTSEIHDDGNDSSDDDGGPASVRRGLTSSEKMDLTEVFTLCDSDASGALDWQEMRRALRGLGFSVSKKEARQLLRTADKRFQTGYITLPQFMEVVEMMAARHHDRTREIINAFRLFDKSGTGHVTVEDLRKLATEVGEDLSTNDLDMMIRVADANGTGKVGGNEFKRIMMRTNLFRLPGDEVGPLLSIA